MRITLYNNCRLTKEFNEVIEHSFLDAYLSTLTKYEYDVPVSYLSRKGQFTFSLTEDSNDYDFDSNIQFNYMKVYDDENDIERYYFIDDYEIVNGTAVIDYTEDIFANYGHKINIVKGKVSNLRYGIGQRPFFLPVEYESNDKLSINGIYQSNTEFELIVIISIYANVKQGEVSHRFYRTYHVERTGNDYSLSSTLDLLKSIVANSSYPEAFSGLASAYNNYDVVNAYILPKNIYDDLGISLSSTTAFISGPVESGGIITLQGQVDLTQINVGEYIKNYTINYDKKLYGFGMLDNIVPINVNGTNIQASIECRIENMFVNFILKVGTSIIDLSNSFVVDCPISVQSADVTQQQAIARSVKNQSLDIDKQQLQERLSTNLLRSTGKGIQASVLLGNTQGSMGIGQYTGAVGDIVDTAYSFKFDTERNDLQKWQTNYEMYKSNTAVSLRDNKFISLHYGLVLLSVVPDNEEYVNNMIEVTGYNTERIVTDNTLLTTAQENKDYNIIKFSNIWLYGNIPHKIQDAVKSILLKGIKIWFTANIS